MKKDIRYVGLDVDSERVAVAVADAVAAEVRSLGMWMDALAGHEMGFGSTRTLRLPPCESVDPYRPKSTGGDLHWSQRS